MTIDCSSVSSVDDFWNLYVSQDVVEGRSVFGRNFDALWDALTGGGPGHPVDTDCIKLVGSRDLMLIDGGTFYNKLVSFSKDLEDCAYCEVAISLD